MNRKILCPITKFQWEKYDSIAFWKDPNLTIFIYLFKYMYFKKTIISYENNYKLL